MPIVTVHYLMVPGLTACGVTGPYTSNLAAVQCRHCGLALDAAIQKIGIIMSRIEAEPSLIAAVIEGLRGRKVRPSDIKLGAHGLIRLANLIESKR